MCLSIIKYENIGGTKINCPPNPNKKEVGTNRKIVHPLQNKKGGWMGGGELHLIVINFLITKNFRNLMLFKKKIEVHNVKLLND
jgi:hypothetical protein